MEIKSIKSTPEDLVSISKDRKVITTSKMVASYFRKRHDHVLRDIENLIKRGLSNFGESNYLNKQNRKQRMYIIDRTGFTILAMGFTGEKAFDFKVRYIQAFDAMESELIRQKEAALSRSAGCQKGIDVSSIEDIVKRSSITAMNGVMRDLDTMKREIALANSNIKAFMDKKDSEWKQIAEGWKEVSENCTRLLAYAIR